jgi:hypothetical protein
MLDECASNHNETEDASARSPVGKIARLPYAIREQLNQRLLDNQPASEILPWLNGLPAVKKILAAQFKNVPLIRQNLDSWRQGGYQEWLKDWKDAVKYQRTAQYAARISRAGRGKIAAGAVTIISSQIIDQLNASSNGQRSAADLAKIAFAATALLHAEQSHTRLKFEKTRVRLRHEQVTLQWDKHQRDVVAIAQRVLNDEQAKAIQESKISNAEKIELLGLRLFGDLWQTRLPSEPDPSTQPPPNTTEPPPPDGTARQT